MPPSKRMKYESARPRQSCLDGPQCVCSISKFTQIWTRWFRLPYVSSSQTGRSWRNLSLRRTRSGKSMRLCAIHFEMILSLTSLFFVRGCVLYTASVSQFPNVDQTPPRRELKVSDPKVRDLTLFQLQLAPSSVLLLGFLDESLNSGFSSQPCIVLLNVQYRKNRCESSCSTARIYPCSSSRSPPTTHIRRLATRWKGREVTISATFQRSGEENTTEMVEDRTK